MVSVFRPKLRGKDRTSAPTGQSVSNAYGIGSRSKCHYHQHLLTLRLEPGPGTVAGRVALECKPIQIPDVQSEPGYALAELMRKAGARTILGVPLLRKGIPIGVLVMMRCRMEVFTNKQVELITTFADQAVIAIENVRLFDEIQDKNRQLAEASEHKSQFVSSVSHEPRTPLLESRNQQMTRSSSQGCPQGWGLTRLWPWGQCA